ncbi:hypothetical protein ALC53_02228, partial [Atta colombica]
RNDKERPPYLSHNAKSLMLYVTKILHHRGPLNLAISKSQISSSVALTVCNHLSESLFALNLLDVDLA